MTQLLIQNLLSKPYQSNQFKKQILAEIFRPRVREFELLSSDTIERQNLTSGEKEIAQSVNRYGSMITADDKRIDLYEIVLQENRIIERNKVAVGSLVKNKIIGNNAVFASFVYPEGCKEAWRFSFISKDSILEDGEIKQIETNPKRYTYILGPGESCRTAADRFNKLIDNSHINLKDIQEAFSVEKISKQFFREYKEHYLYFVDYLNKSKYKVTAFNNEEKTIRDFCKKLLGRIVFLYFLQKKGWLGTPVDGKWGEGDPVFLKNLFFGTGANKSFYAAALSTLFFDTLNSIRENDLCELIDGKPCRIPYLNGGLFEKESDKYDFLTFPPQLFTDLFAFFDSYNFTIYEDSPEEHTMAVDPEMLGHIFENLLEDNKDKGAYYTPKEIVHYMTQESLIEYLFTGLNTEHVEMAPNRKIRDLFAKGEQAGMTFDQKKDNVSREDIEHFIKQKETTDYIEKNATKIDHLLDNVKICDPAIGSGAFPMGLLHEIYSAKQVLFSCNPKNNDWNPARVKENIIQNSIYGVDIEKGAVDIARLRFWLSLIVDEETPRPLPNLDYKIVVGNSLVPKFEDEVIEIDWDLKSSVGKADEYVQRIQTRLKQVVAKQKNYFKPGGDKHQQKKEIRDLKIKLLINQISLNKLRYKDKNPLSSNIYPTAKDLQKDLEIKTNLAGFNQAISKLKTLLGNDKSFDHFDWKLDLPDVMNENIVKEVGFDIVIGNPPYIGEKGNKNKFREIKVTKYGKKFYKRKMDYFYFFFHIGIDLLNNSGILSLITTNYFSTATAAIKLREDLNKRTNIIKLINFNELKIFETATGQHNQITFLIRKKTADISAKIITTKLKGFISYDILKHFLDGSDNQTITSIIKNSELYETESLYLKNIGQKSNTIADSIFKKILKNASPLQNYFNVAQGILSGVDRITKKHVKKDLISEEYLGNGVYVLNKQELEALNLAVDEQYLIKPWFKNSDIDSYVTKNKPTQFLIYARRQDDIDNYPSIKSHFIKFEKVIKNRSSERGEIQAALKQGKWWVIFAAREKSIFENEKIICPQRSLKNKFGYNTSVWFASADVYYITRKDKQISLKYLLALLNSKLFYFWLYNKGKRKGESLELYYKPLTEIPIKYVSKNIQNYFINISEQIINHKNIGFDVSNYLADIDKMFYKLYQLTYDEVIVVDPEFSLSREEYEKYEIN